MVSIIFGIQNMSYSQNKKGKLADLIDFFLFHIEETFLRAIKRIFRFPDCLCRKSMTIYSARIQA